MNRKMLSSPRNVRRAPLALGFSLVAVALAATAAADTLKPVTGMRVPGILAESSLVGRVPGTTVLHMSMALAPANRAAMAAYANALSNPRSTAYHQFLTPAQIGMKFGPSASTVNQAVSFLKSKGMTVATIADNRMAILFAGTATKVESAFGVHMNRYADPGRKDGPKQFPCYDSVPMVPSSLATSVVAIGGMQGAYVPKHLDTSTLTPPLARTLYKSASLYGTGAKRNESGRKGEGVNIAISNYDGYSLADAKSFLQLYSSNLSSSLIVTKVPIAGSDGELFGAGVEGNLDIQEVLANAPYCHLYIYDGSFAFSEQDYYDNTLAVLTQEAQDDVVDIVTESYEFPTDASTRSYILAMHDQHVAMTLEGITYLTASGDYGTDRTRGGQDGTLAYNYPHIDPETLQVGGTVATVDALGNRLSEVGWSGSGGSYSNDDYAFNVLPSYQVGPGVPTTIDRRLFPDVAVHAAGGNDESTDIYYEGFSIVYFGELIGVTGTSGASPLLAGELGIMLQELSARGLTDIAPNGRARFGRLNDFIYELGSTASYNSAFTDITSGDSGPLPQPLPNGQVDAVATPGWDFVTGWGAPNVQGFIDAYAATVTPVLPPTTASIYSVTVTKGGVTSNLPLGTNPGGAIPASVITTDGISYTLTSVAQPGVGQVAAVTMDFTLSGTPVNTSLTASVMSPAKTTEYLYLYNYTKTNADPALNYDLVQTVNGTGSMASVNVNVDLTKYLSPTGGVRFLARGLKPSRFGNTSFILSVDRATLRTRVVPQ